MISSKDALTTIVMAILLVSPFSSVAAVVENVWEEIDTVIVNDQDCGDATAFRLEGMLHRKVSTLRNGMYALHINAMGDFTPLDGENAGEPAIFRQNINNVLPIFEEGVNAVHTISETVKVIGHGQGHNFRLNFKGHVTFIDGEVKSFFESLKAVCW